MSRSKLTLCTIALDSSALYMMCLFSPGITGHVSIDPNGDRNADYSLLNYNPAKKKFDVAGNYLGSEKEYRSVILLNLQDLTEKLILLTSPLLVSTLFFIIIS